MENIFSGMAIYLLNNFNGNETAFFCFNRTWENFQIRGWEVIMLAH